MWTIEEYIDGKIEKSVQKLTCIWADRGRCNRTMEKTMVLSFVAIFWKQKWL